MQVKRFLKRLPIYAFFLLLIFTAYCAMKSGNQICEDYYGVCRELKKIETYKKGGDNETSVRS